LAYSKLEELLEVHKDYPMTTNSQFISHSRPPQQDPSMRDLESTLRARLQTGHNMSVAEISQMLSNLNTKPDFDMDMVAAEEALDNMDSYYQVWREDIRRNLADDLRLP